MDFSVLEFRHFIDANRGFSLKPKNRMTSIVDPDETAHYEPCHLDIHCFQRRRFWSAGLKEIKGN